MILPTPGLTIEQQPESALLRVCLCDEAAGEPHQGKLAIIYVLENRAVKSDGTIKAEILKPRQFSGFNDDSPHRPRLLDLWHLDPQGWAAVDAICSLYESKSTINPIGTSTNYYAPALAHPFWGRGNATWKEVAEIGRHVFGIAGYA